MTTFGSRAAERRLANAAALAAFGAESPNADGAAMTRRRIRHGAGATVYTIGYERRNGAELVSQLARAGVEVLVDVRERPMSRKPDFRKAALEQHCNVAGMAYESWPALGSTGHQRDQLRETGNVDGFRRHFRDFARRYRREALDDLAVLAEEKTIGLLCYERVHEECHRSVVADLVAKRIDAEIVAFV